MKSAYKYALQELENAHCNFNNAPTELQGYYYFKIKAAEALVDDILRKRAEDINTFKLLQFSQQIKNETLYEKLRGWLMMQSKLLLELLYECRKLSAKNQMREFEHEKRLSTEPKFFDSTLDSKISHEEDNVNA
jgi:hypothetical protein